MQMLFGDGQPDMAHFAADRPLTAPPGERFNYSSGTSNIISGVVARTVGPGESYARFLHSRLFGPLGMTSADPEFDEAGTWVASSYLRASARDYARFGLLYLRDGMWDGVRILPAGWVDYGRTMVSIDDSEDPPSPYGAHWLGVRGETLDTLNPWGTFRASGYEGQTITICPALDLHGGAARQDRPRARGLPRPVAGRHGAGLRRRRLTPRATRSSGALGRGDEDGDLPVRLLLVLGVGRVGRHGALPPGGLLVAADLAHRDGDGAGPSCSSTSSGWASRL